MRNALESINFRAIGKPAAGILVAVAVILAGRVMMTRYTIDPGAEHAIRNVLAAKYLDTDFPDLKASFEQGEAGAVVERMDYYIGNIAFPSLSSRGGRTHFCVRAEISVDGAPPPNGKSVCYFRMSKSPLYGHVVEDEVAALSYYVPFLD